MKRHGQIVEWDDSDSFRSGIPVPDLDPPWPDDLTIAIVASGASPRGWRELAHKVAALVQPGGHSFPLAEDNQGGRGDPAGKAFLFRRAGRVCGYLALADKPVTGFREPTARYREAEPAERVSSRACWWFG